MEKAIKLLAAALVAAAFAGAAAAQQADEKYFTVDESSIKIEEQAYDGGLLWKPTGRPALAGVVENIGNVVNLVEKIFSVIEKNQPVVDIKVNYANAVPYGITHWTQLEGWNRPGTKRYAFTVNNAYGGQMVKVDYLLHWVHGGSYQGKGKFLTGVTVEPISVWTAWGCKVSLTAEVPDPTVVNVGTHEDPVAAMQAQLRWTIHTSARDIQERAIYYLQGDGYMQELGTPFENAAAARNAARIERASRQINAARFN